MLLKGIFKITPYTYVVMTSRCNMVNALTLALLGYKNKKKSFEQSFYSFV